MSLADHSSSRFSVPRIAVIGAGVIGLACALELARRGAIVRVYEGGEGAGAGASGHAAGMLGLAYEAPDYAFPAMRNLAMRSMQLWPDFAAGLHETTGGGCNFRADGTIACALDADDERGLAEIEAACRALSLPCEDLSGSPAMREPALTGKVARALWLKTDMQVDARLLVTRLAMALGALEARCAVHTPIERIVMRKSRFETHDGEVWDQVLLATGASAAAPLFVDAEGEAHDLGLPAVEPIKGQILALEPLVGAPRHVVRAGALYIAPKYNWTLIGGVSQPGVRDPGVDRDVLDDLRARATRLLPGLALARELDAWAGFRPKLADDGPVMGETQVAGVYVAGGHYRNGVLLAPATGEWLAQLMLDDRTPQGLEAFSPARCSARVEPSHSP